MIKEYTEEEINHFIAVGENIKAAMDSLKDYDLLCGVLSAHVQRMICDKAQNHPKEALELADKFHAMCLDKIRRITGWLRLPKLEIYRNGWTTKGRQ